MGLPEGHCAAAWARDDLTGGAQLVFRRNVDVGDLGVLAQDRDVGDDVDWADVAGDHANAAGEGRTSWTGRPRQFPWEDEELTP